MPNITDLINIIKDFYCVTDFQKEILDWHFISKNAEKLLNNNKIVIGHPIGSHKGSSLGDILPYTRLPEEIYKLTNKKIYVPQHFYNVFKYNPYVIGIDNNLSMWGSLGTFGTTVQRTCNVWGIKTKYFSPKVYFEKDIVKKNKYIAIGLNSNAGGKLKNLKHISEILFQLKQDGFIIIQIATNKDQILPFIDEYYFNLSFKQLKQILASCDYYIGIHSSLYHVAKAVGTKIIGILPETEDTYFVKLPFLTQCNYLETEMLPIEQKQRMNIWMKQCRLNNKDPNNSHHVGWFYPDTPHLTMDKTKETQFVPYCSISNIYKAMNNEIYPYNNPILYDYYQYSNYWI